MRNICKRAAVHQRGRMLQRLDQIRLQGILQQCRHRAHRLKLSRCDRLSCVIICDNDSGKSLLEVFHIFRQTEDRHDLTRHRDDKMILPDNAVRLLSQSDHNISQHSVIHVKAALPDDLSCVDL